MVGSLYLTAVRLSMGIFCPSRLSAIGMNKLVVKLEFGGQVFANAFVGEATSLPGGTTLQNWVRSGEFVQLPTFRHSTSHSKNAAWRASVASPTVGWAIICPLNNNLIYCKTKGIQSFSLYHQLKINATKKIFQIPPVQNRNCVVK